MLTLNGCSPASGWWVISWIGGKQSKPINACRSPFVLRMSSLACFGRPNTNSFRGSSKSWGSFLRPPYVGSELKRHKKNNIMKEREMSREGKSRRYTSCMVLQSRAESRAIHPTAVDIFIYFRRIYICISISLYIYMYIYLCMYILYIYIYSYIYVYVYIYIYMYIYIFEPDIYVYLSIYIYIYVYIFMYIFVYIVVYIYICMCIIFYIFIYIYIYMYT